MTIAGFHTVHELSDLWSAYSFELAALNAAAAQATTAWRAADPTGYAAFSVLQTKFQALVSGTIVPRLSPVSAGASKTSVPNWDATPALDTSGDVFDWLVTEWAGDESTGGQGFNDLDRMFRASPVASLAPSYKGMPQPTAPDFDLKAYGLADAAWKQVKNLAAKGTSWLTYGLLAGGALALWYYWPRSKP